MLTNENTSQLQIAPDYQTLTYQGHTFFFHRQLEKTGEYQYRCMKCSKNSKKYKCKVNILLNKQQNTFRVMNLPHSHPLRLKKSTKRNENLNICMFPRLCGIYSKLDFIHPLERGEKCIPIWSSSK